MPKERMAPEVIPTSASEEADEFGMQEIFKDIDQSEKLLEKRTKNPTLAKAYANLLQQHEWELEKILGHFFHSKKEKRNPEVNKRLNDLLTTLEQTSRALDALRKKYPNISFPQSIKVIESATRVDDMERVLQLRDLIQRGEDTDAIMRVAQEIQEHLDLPESFTKNNEDAAEEKVIVQKQREALKQAERYTASKKSRKAA